MREELIMDAISELDESLVEEHLKMRQELSKYAQNRKKALYSTISVAACAVILIVVTLFSPIRLLVLQDGIKGGDVSDGIADNDGITNGDGGPTDDFLPEGGDGENVPPSSEGDNDGVNDDSGDSTEDIPYVPDLPEEMPSHFQFSLVWGTYGISSYDSQTGELIKTTDATNPEDYKTTLSLSREQKEEIYRLIYELDVGRYPEKYNPFPDYGSDPSYTIILSVYDGVGVKNIECREIAIPDGVFTMDAKAKAFIETYRAIRDILTESEEWQALPEYENFYD